MRSARTRIDRPDWPDLVNRAYDLRGWQRLEDDDLTEVVITLMPWAWVLQYSLPLPPDIVVDACVVETSERLLATLSGPSLPAGGREVKVITEIDEWGRPTFRRFDVPFPACV